MKYTLIELNGQINWYILTGTTPDVLLMSPTCSIDFWIMVSPFLNYGRQLVFVVISFVVAV